MSVQGGEGLTGVDFGKTSEDYARHRAGFPLGFLDRLSALGVGLPGQRIVDLGAGTGALARALAARGCDVTAVDVAAEQLAQLRALDQGTPTPVVTRVAPAEDTGLAGGTFDAVTAAECWHWFDRPRAAAEARRLLVPGGRLLIAHLSWLGLPASVVEATVDLVERFHPGARARSSRFGLGIGIYPQWFTDLQDAGFRHLESFSVDVDIPYTHASWRGRMRASAAIGATLPPEEVAAFDAALGEVLLARFPEPLAVPHRAFAVLGRLPP
jgi:SAM-dependent methyltransferase